MSQFRPLLLLPLLFLSLLQAAYAQSAGYAGLIDRVGGQVTARSASGNQFQPAAFTRVRDGDEIDVSAGAEIQIVYFEGRKRESWQGPARFRVKAAGGEALVGKAASSEVKGAPTRVALAAAGNVQRIGGLTLRGGPTNIPDDAAVARARADYAEWVKAADPQDILPELYMIGFLQERRDPALLAPYVEAMLKKQPDRPEVRTMADKLGFPPPAR
jgi:hypothetical protein